MFLFNMHRSFSSFSLTSRRLPLTLASVPRHFSWLLLLESIFVPGSEDFHGLFGVTRLPNDATILFIILDGCDVRMNLIRWQGGSSRSCSLLLVPRPQLLSNLHPPFLVFFAAWIVAIIPGSSRRWIPLISLSSMDEGMAAWLLLKLVHRSGSTSSFLSFFKLLGWTYDPSSSFLTVGSSASSFFNGRNSHLIGYKNSTSTLRMV